jgi:hypothetical protein
MGGYKYLKAIASVPLYFARKASLVSANEFLGEDIFEQFGRNYSY